MNSRHGIPAAPGLIERTLLNIVAPGTAQHLSIVIYHRVLPSRDSLFPAEVDRADFDQQIGMLKSGFQVIPLIDAVYQMRNGTLPPRAACITFDDGYADNAEVALPILQAHGVNATFFIATGFLNGGRMWNDTIIELVRLASGTQFDAGSIKLGCHAIDSIAARQAAIRHLIGKLKYVPMDERKELVGKLAAACGTALPDNLMMTTAQVQQLHAAGMGIGAHTVNHPILARLPLAKAQQEISGGRDALAAMIGEPVRLFAYPNGKPGEDYAAEHVHLVRELGFDGAVSTSWGCQPKPPDLFQLARFTPWDRSRLRFLARMGMNLRKPAAVC